jgi:hypothetical protein
MVFSETVITSVGDEDSKRSHVSCHFPALAPQAHVLLSSLPQMTQTAGWGWGVGGEWEGTGSCFLSCLVSTESPHSSIPAGYAVW